MIDTVAVVAEMEPSLTQGECKNFAGVKEEGGADKREEH
jgi:hypothetical protein